MNQRKTVVRLLVSAALLIAVSGCSTLLASGSKVDSRVGVANDAYMSVFRGVQKGVCQKEPLVAGLARMSREEECTFIKFDCDAAQACYQDKGWNW